MTTSKTDINRLRNIGIVAHIDAGKTTTTERILYYTGRTHKLGSVDEGSTVTDWMEQERERGITIVSAAISAEWREHRINLIDTPGHIDFTAEVQRSLRVLDGAIVVFDAVHGVEPQSETVWRQADRYRVPRLCFVNKMDRLGADFATAVASIRNRLGAIPACLQIPVGAENDFAGVIDLLNRRLLRWHDSEGIKLDYDDIPEDYRDAAATARQRLIEAVAETDDEILAFYLDNQEPSTKQLAAALRRATLASHLFPVFCGAALRNIGIQPLLDGVTDYLPSPLEAAAIKGEHPQTGEPLERHPADDDALAALVFKVVNDPYVGHLAYVRVYSGTIRTGATVYNPGSGQKERIGRLLRMYANHREDVDALHAGDIAAILGSRARTGDTLCAESQPILLENISFPEPVIRATVEPRTVGDQERMNEGLKRLVDEDPTLALDRDEETGQMVIAGMGELHLEVLVERLRREYGVQARMGKPHATYKETITRAARTEGRFVRQSGGHGMYGHVILELTPGEQESGLVYENALSGDEIPKQFLPAVEKGVRAAAQNGVLGGYAVTDIKVRLVGGSSHDTDSNEIAFQGAVIDAFREGMEQGQPTLLEPILKLEVIAPAEYTGAVLGQLSARRAIIKGTEPRPGGVEAIQGFAPLAELFGYVTELRSATQGRGLLSMQFDHYAAIDPSLARTLLGGF